MDRLEGLTNQLLQTKGGNTLYESYLSSIKELQVEKQNCLQNAETV